MPPEKSIPFEGVLNCWNDEHDLPDLLLAVSRSGKTGRLSFSNAEADKTLYIKSGKVVFAESSSDDDALGQYLLRTGKISLQDYTRVSKQVGPGKRFGALLVAEGVLEPKELVPAVIGQVRAIIQGLFRRTETWYGLKEEELTRKEAITLDMPISQIILDGVQQVQSWRRISKGIGQLDSVYALQADTEAEWKRLKLDPAVTELLEMLREPISVAEICTDARLADFEACRYLWAFRVLGWIEPAAAPAEEEDSIAESAVDDDAPPSLSEEEEAPSEATTMAAALAADMVEAAPKTPPRPIPQRLVETQIATAKQMASASAPKPAPAPIAAEAEKTTAAPARRAIPENLVHTQVAAGDSAKAPPKVQTPESQVTTLPSVQPPQPVPEELAHTQMFVQPPKESAPPPPSAGEMMEAILGEDEPAANPPASPPKSSDASTQFFAKKSSAPTETPPPTQPASKTPPANDSTQLFDGASALASTAPPGDLDAPARPERPANDSTQLFAEKTALAAPTPSPEAEPPSKPPNDSTQFFPGETALAPPAPLEVAPSEPEPPPAPPKNDATQIFAEASALGGRTTEPEEVAKPAPESTEAPGFDVGTYEDFFKTEMSGEFAALSLDYGTPPPPSTPQEAEAPPPATEPTLAVPATDAAPTTPNGNEAPVASFGGVAFTEASIDPASTPEEVPLVPLVEATVVEASDGDAVVPVIEGDVVSPEPEVPSGMEMFAVTDPFLTPNVPELPRFKNEANPVQFNEEEVGAALPRRATRADDLDMDMDGLGHVFGNDD